MRGPGLEHERHHMAAPARPGSVILFGAVAAGFGAVSAVGAIVVYALLSGPAPAASPAQIELWRSPEAQMSLWVTLVTSVFLTTSGLGIIRAREWARTLFLALSAVRLGVLVLSWASGIGPDSWVGLGTIVLRDLVLFGGGALFLTRPRVRSVFRDLEEDA